MTDRQTHYDGIYRASIASRGKNVAKIGTAEILRLLVYKLTTKNKEISLSLIHI